ncbi:MAG: MmgE/PrpD family protein [Acidobacteria bacterium]|nr:MmgE/PrpD family protein [Acidobacteriota bacterium]
MTLTAVERLAEFVAGADVPDEGRAAACGAVQDTIGVMLAGSAEPVASILRRTALAEVAEGPASLFGTPHTTSATWAALVNGTAAHALDFDDMCWTSMAHPSAPLVAAGMAVAESIGASGRRVLEGYVVGFEIEAALGRAMNPSHYEQGWHCTSTIGTIGAAAAAARVMGLGPEATGRALAIAASEASGLKENFGTMVKPLHAGLAARNGVLAALLARHGLTASRRAIDGPQGLLVAMLGGDGDLEAPLSALGHRWEIVDEGITVKLYPSCAGTHPTIDTLIDLRRELDLGPDDIAAVDVGVDAVMPTVLIHDRPTSGLEAKFSLHFCAAASLAHGRVGMDVFEVSGLQDPVVQGLIPRVTMRVDDALIGASPPLTHARIKVTLSDGRTLERAVSGARGYPDRPASREERDGKFLECAARCVSPAAAARALDYLKTLDTSPDTKLGALLIPPA